MMNLLPNQRFAIQTTHPLTQVIAALEKHIEAPRRRWGLSDHRAPYAGILTVSGFEIRRIIHYRNSFLPQIKGRFESGPLGTTVHVSMGLHPLVLIFLLMWSTPWLSFGIPILLFGVLPGNAPIEMGLMPLVPISILTVVWFTFRHESNRSRQDLTAIIQGQTAIDRPQPPQRRLKRQWLKSVVLTVVVINLIGFFHFAGGVHEGSRSAHVATPCAESNPSPYCGFELVQTLTGHPEAAHIALSADGTTLISGGQDKAIKVWDVQTGVLKRTLQSDSGVVTALAISVDNTMVLSGHGDRMLRLWDLTTDQPPTILQGHTSQNVAPVAISTDGSTLISGGYRELNQWDRNTGSLQTIWPEDAAEIQVGPVTIQGSSPALRIFDLSADGTTVLVEQGSKLLIWDLTTGQKTALPHQWFTHVNGARLSPDGQTVITTSYTQPKSYLQIWDVKTGELRAKILLSSNRESWSGDRLVLTNDRAIVSTPTGLRFWNLQTGELDATLGDRGLQSVVVSPDGQQLAGLKGDFDSAQIQIWQR
ncbi:MAG: WD40 repeat domain-containing protein [Leptolyngbyaceae cyanobacterium]